MSKSKKSVTRKQMITEGRRIAATLRFAISKANWDAARLPHMPQSRIVAELFGTWAFFQVEVYANQSKPKHNTAQPPAQRAMQNRLVRIADSVPVTTPKHVYMAKIHNGPISGKIANPERRKLAFLPAAGGGRLQVTRTPLGNGRTRVTLTPVGGPVKVVVKVATYTQLG